VAELAPNNSKIRSYLWGTDLSGSIQGAGGVGGLLEVSYYGTSTTNCFPAFDGNGNVAALINAADGTVVANYEYGPFGEPIRITGAMANNNPFLFSTKYYDSESGLYYYGYRFYNPSTGMWPNRDPIEEAGGINLYAFNHNSPLNFIDLNGNSSAASTLWGLFGDCAKTLLGKSIAKYMDKATTCNELLNRIRGNQDPFPRETPSYDIDLCKGFHFKSHDDNLEYSPSSWAQDIGHCILSKLGRKTLKELLDEITNPTERKVFEALLKGAADIKPEAKLQVAVDAGCQNGQSKVTMNYYTTITAGSASISTDPQSVGPFTCPLVSAMNKCCCSAGECGKK
jgi:RHS repeat-associated protein